LKSIRKPVAILVSVTLLVASVSLFYSLFLYKQPLPPTLPEQGPTPTPTPQPSSTPSPTPSTTPNPAVTFSPLPSPSPTPTPTLPSKTPVPTPKPTPEPYYNPTPSPAVSPTPAPSFRPAPFGYTYGGTGEDKAYALVATSDGGYALAGTIDSFGAGGGDFWLVKTDVNGVMQWNRTYGGAGDELAYSLVVTSDGGYALAGYTGSYGARDFLLVKTDALGNMKWNRTFGGTGDDWANSLVVTSDGGYALAGVWNFSSYFDLDDRACSGDFWLVKTDASGNMLWNKTYGGTLGDWASSLVVTSDGGYALAGKANSFNGYDGPAWLVKTDSLGNMEWNKTYGEAFYHFVESLVVTSDGGYALAGYALNSNEDYWLVKTDALGNMEWNQTYNSGRAIDNAHSVIETTDGGYAILGNIGIFDAGGRDFWLVKTDALGNMEWNQTYGGGEWDYAYSVVEASDGGYALAGETSSFGAGWGDFWLIRTDSMGKPR
jgi:hypothetical protein